MSHKLRWHADNSIISIYRQIHLYVGCLITYMTYVDKIKGEKEEAKIPPMISEFQSSYMLNTRKYRA